MVKCMLLEFIKCMAVLRSLGVFSCACYLLMRHLKVFFRYKDSVSNVGLFMHDTHPLPPKLKLHSINGYYKVSLFLCTDKTGSQVMVVAMEELAKIVYALPKLTIKHVWNTWSKIIYCHYVLYASGNLHQPAISPKVVISVSRTLCSATRKTDTLVTLCYQSHQII